MMWKDLGPRVLVRPRRAGKTHEAIQWVLEGHRIDTYPGWSRVLIVPDMRQADELRAAGNPHGLDYRQVYFAQEWRDARVPNRHEIQTAVDNAETMLQGMLGGTGIGLITMTGTDA